MPNTITAYYTFAPGKKARSANVNTNFSNYRGTVLPIEEDTATASHQSHDLGATDHQWREIFCQTLSVTNGLDRNGMRARSYTGSAALGQFARAPSDTGVLTLSTSSSAYIPNSTISVYGGGGPIFIGLAAGTGTVTINTDTNALWLYRVLAGTTSTVAIVAAGTNNQLPSPFWIDVSVTAATATYYFLVSSTMTVNNLRSWAYEV